MKINSRLIQIPETLLFVSRYVKEDLHFLKLTYLKQISKLKIQTNTERYIVFIDLYIFGSLSEEGFRIQNPLCVESYSITN